MDNDSRTYIFFIMWDVGVVWVGCVWSVVGDSGCGLVVDEMWYVGGAVCKGCEECEGGAVGCKSILYLRVGCPPLCTV